MAKHTQKHDPNQVESAVMADIAIGLTETDLLALSQRPPLILPEDKPMPDISVGDLKILAACKDTILATRKEKVKEALLLRVFHRSRFYRYMQCATFEDFAREHFCMSRTTAYETLYFSDAIVTMAAAGVSVYPGKSQALDLRYLKLSQEGQVIVWKDALARGADVTDTQFMAALKESELVDKAKLEELLRKKAISNGRPKTNTGKLTQSADKVCRALLTEIARTLSRPENAKLFAAIMRGAEKHGGSVGEFVLEAACEKLERSGGHEAAPQPSDNIESVETGNGADSINSTIPSEDDGAAHAVPPEAIPATTHPVVDEDTERFEEIYAKTVKLSASPQCFTGATRTNDRLCGNGCGLAVA